MPAEGLLSRFAARLNSRSEGNPLASQGRVLSVDALRGFDMFWITGGGIIFLKLADAVRSPVTAAIARQLEHVPWAGFHFYDLIHPLFLFVVGLVMPVSFRRRLAASSPTVLWNHILKRVAILWILGMVVQGNLLSYRFSKVAFYSNTLQTIAVGYLIASVLMLYMSVSGQLFFTLGMLLVYGAILALVPVPGIGKPILEPYHNIAAYLDSLILGSHVDGTDWTWILPSMSFGALVMAGVFACHILQSAMTSLRKTGALLAIGGVLTLAGKAVALFQPMIKRLYTPSYVLFSAGLCFLLMALFYLLIDHWKLTRWTSFFIIIGSNSIFAYVLGELYGFDGFAGIFLQGLKVYLGDWYPLVLSIGAYAVFWLVLWHLYKQKIFIKV
jgi:predicted acyltransferase